MVEVPCDKHGPTSGVMACRACIAELERQLDERDEQMRKLRAALEQADEYILLRGVEEDGSCFVCECLEDGKHEDGCPLVGARSREWEKYHAHLAALAASEEPNA